MTHSARIGVIGGSGVYDLPGLSHIEEVNIETPFGAPSDAYILGELDGQKVAWLDTAADIASTPPTSTAGPTSGASSGWAWNTSSP